MCVHFILDQHNQKPPGKGQEKQISLPFFLVSLSLTNILLSGTLPSPKETIKGNIKTITEYKIDDDGKKFKVI